MKGIGAAFIAACGLLLAGCGGDTSTNFVLTTQSPTTTGSPGASPGAGPSGSASPASPSTGAATPIPGGARIIIDSPDASSTISSPVQVSGTASVDNGTVVAVVLDPGGAELGRGTATASAAKPEFGHFDITVSFSGAPPGSTGKLKVFGVGRDGSTPTYFYFINVRFP